MSKMESRSKIAACIRCSVVFSARDPLSPRGNRVPHVLHCGHSICEGCLLAALQIDASVACTKCAKQSLQRQGMKNLNKEFPINLFVLGQLMERSRSRIPQDSKITFIPPNSPAVAKSVSTVSVKVMGAPQPACSECTENDAEWSCENCPANYCSPCFTKVHAAARSLKAHVRAPITVHAIPMCSAHSDQRKDFFCHRCNEIICPCCAISFHMGHPVVTRTQMNEEYMDNVLAAVMVATAVLEEITKSKQKLLSYLPAEERPPGSSVSGRERTNSSSSSSGGGGGGRCNAGPCNAGPSPSPSVNDDICPLEEVERAVARHFAFAHGLLQLQEAQILDHLNQAAGATKASALAALRELNGAAERTRALLAEANHVATSGQLKWCDLRDLTRRLLDSRHERCRLSDRERTEPQVRFHVNSGFVPELSKHCHLDMQQASTIQLEPLGDSPATSSKSLAAPAKSPVAPNVEEPNPGVSTDTSVSTSIPPAGVAAIPASAAASAAVELAAASASDAELHPDPDPDPDPDAVSLNTDTEATLPPSKPSSIATANIVATATAAALAANCCKTESPVTVSSSQRDKKPNDNTQPTRPARAPRRSSRGRQSKRGKVGNGASPRFPPVSIATIATKSNAPSAAENALPVISVPPVALLPSPVVSPNPYSPFFDCQEKPFVAVGIPEVVRVVHIKNPAAFYVHRDQDKSILEDLQKFLDNCPEHEHSPPDIVTIDEMFICKFLVDDRWYRVTVKSCSTMLNPPESRDAIVDVFYVDYGNSERIPLSRLRPLPPQVKDVPPYALHCALFDLHPKTGGQWPEDANRAFCKMVNGARVHMNVMAFIDDIYYIDLCAIPGMKHTNFPVSIRDAMVFMDLAQLEDDSTLNIRQASSHFDNEYLKEEPLAKNENFPVVLSHINSPSQFYAQRRGCHAEYLTKLLDDMSKYYTIDKESMIYDPGVGMPCASLFSLDKGWYRAQVLSIPKKSWVEVMYVDYGNKEEVPYTNIRKLPEMFMRIPPQAIQCSLADVMPTKGNVWPKTATEFFLSVTKDKELRLLVNDVSKPCAKVVLYEEKENVDVCLNALLVREGHALSIGVGGRIVEYFKVEAAVPEEAKQFQTIKPSRRKYRKAVKSDPGGIGFLAEEGKNATCSSSTKDLSGESAGPLFSMPINIVTVNSPGCLYVSPCSNEEEIANLMVDIQDHYDNIPASERNWQENEKCCAWSAKHNKWFRAVILEMHDDKAKVFYKDIATPEMVPTNCLRYLDEKFANVHDGAFRCHMVGIHPAGGQNKWSAVACEMFTDLVSRTYSELFITKKGDIEDNSLPIELWARCTVSPGPLEPNRIEWISLNQVLVQKGMAIPTNMPESQEITEHSANSLKSEFVDCNFGEGDDDKYGSENSDRSESSEEDNYRHELILRPENPKRQWLEAPPLKKHSFIGMTTYVDSQGLIHLYDVANMETLVLIRDALNKCLKDSKPKPQDMYWFPGQMCLAQFHADKYWYRGKIIKQNENNMYEVLFVDYGNIELCSLDMLRKDVIMDHIPILSRKFQLHDILPASCDGKWDVDHLDFLHLTLDGKRCSVIIRSALDDPCPSISLILPGKIDVAQLLVNLHYAIYSSNVLGNDTSSTVGSENSVIIENVEETMEMISGCADMNLKTDTKTHKLESLENEHCKNSENIDDFQIDTNKSDVCDDDDDDDDDDADGQTQEYSSQISQNKELPCSNKDKETRTEDGGGDFIREKCIVDLQNCKTENIGMIGDFGDVAETKVEDSDLASTEEDCTIQEEHSVEMVVQKNSAHSSSNSLVLDSSESSQNVTASEEMDLALTHEIEEIEEDPNANVPEDSVRYENSGGKDREGNLQEVPKISESAITTSKSHKLWSDEQEDQEENEESMESSEEILTYKKLNLEGCDTIFVEVSVVMDDPTQVVLVPAEGKNEQIVGIDFNLMTMQMQDEAPYRPVINHPYNGQPCCALYSEDMQWYRAIILQVQNNQMKARVEFVDYGNVEWIDIKSIHIMKPAWMTIPAQVIKCNLWNVKIPEDTERRTLIKVLTKLIFNSVLTAKIKRRDPLSVELYKCATYTLAYQPLLDTGLLEVGDENEEST